MKKYIHAHGLEESILFFHTTQRNLQIQYNSYQNFNGIFHINKTILKVVWNHKNPYSHSMLRNKNIAGSITLTDLKLDFRR